MSITRLAFIFLFVVALSEMALAQSVQSQLDLVAPAETLMRQGNYNSALAELDKIIKAHPRHNLAYFMRGSVKLYIGDLKGSMTDTETAIRLAPKVFGVEKAYNNRGVIHQMRGEIDKALADFDKAIELNRNYYQPYNGRGVILEKKGRIDEALAAFEKAIELDPRGPAAYVGRSDIRFQRNDFEGAIYDINKLIDLDPGNSSAYIRRGIIRGLQNRWEFGVADIREGFRTFNDPKLTNRGVLSVTFSDLDRYIENNPKNANAVAIRGFINLLRNRDKEAQDDFDRSFTMDEKLRPILDDLISSVKDRR